ncbi:MAG: hypothetical protein DIZ80_01105 [endosymbiont of Galathealinum brachiosum]|uniref:GGDEF-domain containing protein n=1 Tax=endosymbiont of Galathealinum brachiosum TaxID=2200906 RepID=A0A370DP71_9GAMM|nr:MAG: hypothetical protein DIZ80_01105 [endosymbiont of Galathealinum brachiosum]
MHPLNIKYIIILIIFTLISSPVYANYNSQQLNILVIHSYHQEYPWTLSQYEAFKNQLTSGLPEYNINYSTEYLDTKHISPSENYKNNFLLYLSSKYKHNIPDLVYVTDDNALKFIYLDNHDLPWTIPIVFSGINNTKFDTSDTKRPVAGIFEYKDIKSSISLAKTISTNTSNITFLGDGGTTDKAIRRIIESGEYSSDDYNISQLNDTSLDTLLNRLNTMEPGVVILTTIGGIHDRNNNLLSLKKTINALTSTGRKIIVMEDAYLFPGILGGYITSGKSQGKSAAKIAQRILRGELTENIKTNKQNNSEFILSWPEINNFELNLDQDLLKTATIINRPPPFLEQHPEILQWLLLSITLLLITLTGVTYNVRRKSHLLKAQYRDNCTGLENRIKLIRDINHSIDPNLCIIDIKNFKSINNIYGMKIGDNLLASFGLKVSENLSKNYKLYRVGGNQFGILNRNLISPDKFDSYIVELLKDIQNNSYNIKNLEICLTITAGISKNERELLIPRAEQALQKAKELNKDLFIIDRIEDETEHYQKNLLWAQKLNNALSTDHIVPYFQPIIHNKTGKKDKFEALVRLIDDNNKAITPYYFLEAAKYTRQYTALTMQMIEKSFQMIKNRDITISINFTVDDIRDKETIDFFKSKVNQYNVGNNVILELTESEGIENYSEIADFIFEIKKLGCKIAIDDFGTGYSNFTHLIHLNVDYLKIDGSIIQNITSDKNAEIVAKTLVEFSNQLGIETIAEFVDSQEVMDKVIEIGIDYSQGYFLGKPEKTLSL